MKPEAKAELELWDWMKFGLFNGDNIEEIYLNRKNEYEKNLFRIKHKGNNDGKPDMILKINNGFVIEYVAIEVKDGQNKRAVLDSHKILSKYYESYIKGKSKYLIKGKEIKIDYFIVATQFSKEGRLFEKESIESNSTGRKGDKWTDILVPRLEYDKSKQFIRQIFSEADSFRDKHGLKKKGGPAIGILYSDVLLNFDKTQLEIQEGMIGKPIIFCVKWLAHLPKPEWRQRIIKL